MKVEDIIYVAIILRSVHLRSWFNVSLSPFLEGIVFVNVIVLLSIDLTILYSVNSVKS